MLPASARQVVGVKATARMVAMPALQLPVAIAYRYGVVAGSTINNLAGLTSAVYADTQPIITVTAGAGQYIYFAHPTLLSDPRFVYNGFEGGFLDQGTMRVDTDAGVEIFRVWRSTTPNLGVAVSIQIFH